MLRDKEKYSGFLSQLRKLFQFLKSKMLLIFLSKGTINLKLFETCASKGCIFP